MIVLDASSSMGFPTTDGGPTKIQSAVAAAQLFVRQLHTPEDQVGLIRSVS
jgi:hypothetical protein